MSRGRWLTAAEARRLYDRVGGRQETQSFYEQRAVALLLAAGNFGSAARVVEFGCGTGALARRLFRDCLARSGSYVGLDVSATMARLTADRLRTWSGRAVVIRTDGTPRLPLIAGATDRVVATYVLDLLSPVDTSAFLDEAARVLVPDGLLCLAGVTRGCAGVARVVSVIWQGVWSVHPGAVGGCRPVELTDALDPRTWRIETNETVTSYGVSSQVLVAARR